MNDNKKLSKDTFNLQATTYDIDKNGAHARTRKNTISAHYR